ncbi:hypothetical protein [Thiocapsa sp.]|nr:hypothetical protein [Thiocapsa sp.]
MHSENTQTAHVVEARPATAALAASPIDFEDTLPKRDRRVGQSPEEVAQ